MTNEKQTPPAPEEEKAQDPGEKYKKDFAELPLDKKFAELMQLEAMALGETMSYVINSPFTIADKFMDVMADFGFSKERKEKDAARPTEHKEQAKAKKKPHGGKKTQAHP